MNIISSPPAEAKPAADANKKTIKLTYFDECAAVSSKRWIVKNVIAHGETSSWFGPPGKGKSGLLTDLGIHIAAAGKLWRGYRIKERCGVVYFALERGDLVKRRIAAYKRRDSLSELPIAVAGQVIDLMNKTCVEIILDTITEAEQNFGCSVGLIIIDSFSKGIAAGGGDEDKAKDQNRVAAHLRRVIEKTDVHIAGVGHTGKDEGRGERGSNARLADVDVEVHITGDTTKTANVTKANDQPIGPLTGFRLESFQLGVDEDNEQIVTFIVTDDVLVTVKPRQKLTAKQRLALEALAAIEFTDGVQPPTDILLPFGSNAIFRNTRLALLGRDAIGSRDDLVWRTTNAT